jgi:uncharacterized protein YvpB
MRSGDRPHRHYGINFALYCLWQDVSRSTLYFLYLERRTVMRGRRMRVLCGLLVLLLTLTALAGCADTPKDPEPGEDQGQEQTGEPEYEERELLNKNLFVFTTQDDFAQGHNDGTVVSNYGNGAITLADGSTSGTYTSPIIKTSPFEYMILSWNADTPGDSNVTIHGRVRVKGEWSKWLSWGTWSTSSYPGADGKTRMPGSATAPEQEDAIAKVATDELYVKGRDGETADAFQYRLILNSGSESANKPHVRLMASTVRNTLAGQAIPAAVPANAAELAELDHDLDVPVYSQSVRDPMIASSICSPTSVAMALEYFGHEVTPEQSAWLACDYVGNMFGNWSFNVASAASFDLSGYVAYFIQEEGGDPWLQVKEQIAAGNPVIVSVRYRSPESSEPYPVVEGVPISSTGGHLVLVRGFTWENGVEYVIVNDSAAKDNEGVHRKYRADQFAEAWRKVAYVIYSDPAEIGEPSAPTPIQAELVAVGEPQDGFQYFELRVDGEAINVSDERMRGISVSYNGQISTYVTVRTSILSNSQYLRFETSNKPGTYTYTFIDMDKNTYQATIDW